MLLFLTYHSVCSLNYYQRHHDIRCHRVYYLTLTAVSPIWWILDSTRDNKLPMVRLQFGLVGSYYSRAGQAKPAYFAQLERKSCLQKRYKKRLINLNLD